MESLVHNLVPSLRRSATPKACKTMEASNVDEHRILYMEKKNPFAISSQVKKTLEEAGL